MRVSTSNAAVRFTGSTHARYVGTGAAKQGDACCRAGVSAAQETRDTAAFLPLGRPSASFRQALLCPRGTRRVRRRRQSERLGRQSAQGWERTSWLGRDLEIRIIVLLVARCKHGRHQRARVWHGGPCSACWAKSGQRGVSRQTRRRQAVGSARRRSAHAARASRTNALGSREAGARAPDGKPTGGYAPVPRATHPAAPSRSRRSRRARPLCASPRGCRRRGPGARAGCGKTRVPVQF